MLGLHEFASYMLINMTCSRCSSENDIRRHNMLSLPTRSKLPNIHNQHGSPRDHRSRWQSDSNTSRRTRFRERPEIGRSHNRNIRPIRCASIQQRSHLVVECSQHADETLPADAAGQSRGALRLCAGVSPSPVWKWNRPNYRCQSSDLQPLLPWQDCVCHGQSRDECFDHWTINGLEERRQGRSVDF